MLKLIIFDCDGVLFESREANRHYYNHLLAFIRHAREEGFIFDEHEALFVHAAAAEPLLDALEDYRHPGGVERWLREAP